MTWLVIAGATVLVAAVLVYVFVVRWKRMERIGRIEIPCDQVVSLPEGEVVIYYEDGFRWRYSDAPRPWDGFSVLLSDAESGKRVDLADPPSETGVKRSGKNRIPFASVRLPRPGRYRIVAQINADATEPAITFG